MRTLAAFVAVIAFALSSVWPITEAQAQNRSFERLPDGRIFVEIFGQRLALLDSEADTTSFYPYQAGQKRYGKAAFSLVEAMADPEKARATLEEEQQWVGIRIITSRSGPLILERFQLGTVPLSTAADPLIIKIDRVGRQGFARGQLPARWPPESEIPDEDGYYVRPGIIGPNRTTSTDTGYRLPASKRLFQASADMVVVCSHVGAPSRLCRQGLRTEDGRSSISWSWYERDRPPTPFVETWKFAFPQSAWRSFDLKLRELADYLFLNRPAGDME